MIQDIDTIFNVVMSFGIMIFIMDIFNINHLSLITMIPLILISCGIWVIIKDIIVYIGIEL